MCEICKHWARTGHEASFWVRGRLLTTNHHSNCEHYNDSLIAVWEQHPEGQTSPAAISDSEPPSEPDLVTRKRFMHREIFENLPEFEGF